MIFTVLYVLLGWMALSVVVGLCVGRAIALGERAAVPVPRHALWVEPAPLRLSA